MASIEKRISKTGIASWQVRIRIKGSPEIVLSFPSDADARAFARVTERKIRTGHGPTLPGLVAATTALDFQNEQVRAVIRLYVNSEACGKRYKKMAPTVLGNLVDIKVGDMRRSWIKAYLESMRTKNTHMGRPYGWVTLNGHAQLVGLAIKWRAAELDIAVPHYPYSTDLLPKRWQNQRERRLLPDEERALTGALQNIKTPRRDHWILLVRLALASGARLQEMALAEWPEVDFAGREWTLPLEHTKSKYERVVPMSKDILEIMAELRALARSGDNRIFHTLPTTHGVSQGFRIIARNAGIVNFRFHDLRHEAISRMVLHKRKLSPFEIMKIVGHGSLAMLNRYANLRGSDLVDRMD